MLRYDNSANLLDVKYVSLYIFIKYCFDFSERAICITFVLYRP